MFVGTSAGALNAAYLATRSQTVRTAVRLGRLWSGLHREEVPLSEGGGWTPCSPPPRSRGCCPRSHG
jgi:hypothetical protein